MSRQLLDKFAVRMRDKLIVKKSPLPQRHEEWGRVEVGETVKVGKREMGRNALQQETMIELKENQPPSLCPSPVRSSRGKGMVHAVPLASPHS